MVLFNYATRELTAKIVFYGPGLCGKTTNLEYIHKSLPEKSRGKMLSLATQTDRTLFFDFLPLDLGSVKGMKTRVQLYTVPGQVFYDATRKLVLKGADGVVFVVDSQKEMFESNLESWENLTQNLRENGLDINAIPLVIQYNKRDLPNVLSVKDLNKKINKNKVPSYEAIAITGMGVQETLKGIATVVLESLSRRYAKDETEEVAGKAVKEKEPPIELPALEEEVRDLPNEEELEVTEEAGLTLEPVSEPLEEAHALNELEEVHELQEDIHNSEVVTQQELTELSEIHEEIESPPRVEAAAAPGSAYPAPPPSVKQEIKAVPDIVAAKSSPVTKDVSLPIEVTVNKGGQEIKLNISIQLKIHLD